MAERFYCADATSPPPDRLILEGDQAHHLARVRRVRPGESVEVFDGRGHATAAEVVAVERSRVTLRPIGPPLRDRRPAVDLTLATAVPKGDRFDWLVEKASELGVDRLVPLLTERSVVDPSPSKLERLRRACVESAKQCGRNRLMGVDEPLSWTAAVARFRDAPTRLIGHPGGSPFGLWPRPLAGQPAVVAIGPEGGWTAAEVEEAGAAGWRPVGLGPTILRVETAALVLVSRLLATTERDS